MCRSLLTENWPKFLQKVVKAINDTPNAAIGYLKPSQITSNLDDPKVDQAIGIAEDVSFKQQFKNQQDYEKKTSNLQTNDYVYLDFPPSLMEKGFDTPVSA